MNERPQNKNLRPFKPGQSGNPSGRPKIPEELRAIKSLSQQEVTKLVSKYARMSRDEVAAAVQSKTTPMVELAIAAIFAQAAKNGDCIRMSFLLDRAVGRVPTVREMVSEEDAIREDFARLTDKELAERAEALIPQLKAS